MSDDNTPEIIKTVAEATKKGPGRPKKKLEDMRPEPIVEAREEMRASKREEDPRSRAERRAAEVQECFFTMAFQSKRTAKLARTNSELRDWGMKHIELLV